MPLGRDDEQVAMDVRRRAGIWSSERSTQLPRRETRWRLPALLNNKPSLFLLLTVPTVILIGVPAYLWLAAYVGGWVSAFTLLSIVAIFGYLFRGRRAPGDAAVAASLSQASLKYPRAAGWLSKVEQWLYGLITFIITPTIARVLMGDAHGEIGFGGIIFLGGGLLIAVAITCTMVIYLQMYVRENYWLRLSLDAAAIALTVYLVMR